VQKNEEQEEQEQVLFLEGRKKELKKERTALVQPDATTGPGRLVSLRDIAMVSGNL
jgi:hypothetical protein